MYHLVLKIVVVQPYYINPMDYNIKINIVLIINYIITLKVIKKNKALI